MNAEDINKSIALITHGIIDPVVEIRLFKTKKGTMSGYYNKEGFKFIAKDLLGREGIDNVFITLNPVNPLLLLRGANKIRDYVGDTTGDSDITKREWIFIDFDAKRPSGISSSNEEKEKAKDLMEVVLKELNENNFPQPAIADSGNGYHLLYKIDMPNNNDSKGVMTNFLQSLSKKFSNDLIDIDKSVFNASRVIKLYGSLACKGENSADRPHRMSSIISIPHEIKTVSTEDIKLYIEKNPYKAIKSSNTNKNIATINSKSDTKTDLSSGELESWISKKGIGVSQIKRDSDKITFVLDECIFNPDHKAPDAAIFQREDGYGYKCLHNSCSNYHWEDVRNMFDPKTIKKEHAIEIKQEPLIHTEFEFINPTLNKKRYPWNDIGNGNLFADTYKNISRYVKENKEWATYDGKKWDMSNGNLGVMAQAKELIPKMVSFGFKIPDEGEQSIYLKFVSGLNKRNNRETMIKDATDVYPVGIADFDNNKFLFNCQNGVLNLKTFEFMPHDASLLLSKISNVAYNPLALCDRWENFVNEIMENDKQKAKFLQKALGYALSGDTSMECFFILYGATTRNGKGTTMDTISHLLGDYAKTAQPETVSQKTSAKGNEATEDIARLKGARFVNISEPEKGLKLNSALVKQLTGGDVVTARFLNKNSFEYKPEYKIFINTNHLPKVSDNSLFSSGRVKLIPFERHFKPEEQDKGLKDSFKEAFSLSGILNWCIEGLKLLLSEGLESPQSVIDATNEYKEDSDIFHGFISDCFKPQKKHSIPTADIYSIYTKWAESKGYHAVGYNNFTSELKSRSYAKKTNKGMYLIDFTYSDFPKKFLKGDEVFGLQSESDEKQNV